MSKISADSHALQLLLIFIHRGISLDISLDILFKASITSSGQ